MRRLAFGLSTATLLALTLTVHAGEAEVQFAPAVPAADQNRGAWWTALGDDTLNGLEVRLETNSPSLKIALRRYDQARAYLGMAASDQSPHADLLGTGSANRQSDLRPLRGSNQPDQYAANTLGGLLSYEIDLWGRVRQEVAADKAEVAARKDDVLSLGLSLQAELAIDYARLRATDADLAILSATTDAYRKVYALIDARHKGGVASGVDLARAETQVKTVAAQTEDASATRTLYEHAIAVLIGEDPRGFHLAPAPVRLKMAEVPVEVPSDLLQRRPDIAAAEARVAEANALVGLARKAFFPQVAISAALGFQNTGQAGLLGYGNRFWSVGPSADLPVFDGGRRTGVVNAARAQRDIVVQNYRQTVLNAFQDVSDNLALIDRLGAEAQDQGEAVRSARLAQSLSLIRYQKGAVTFLETAISEAAALQADRAYLQIEERRLEASIRLIRAIGGDWRTGA